MAALMEARGVVRHFGGLKAVDGVDFALEQGEIHALIGPNGAGKTTFVSLLSGRLPVQAGQITLAGRDITALPAHARVRAGIAYTFQITSIYPRLSVFENVALAVQSRGGDIAQGVASALARVNLTGFEAQEAGTLSYGHQRLLEVAMGLALHPRVLILDEPTQGLAAGEIEGFKALVRGLVPETTVLLIEHNMDVVMDLAHRITVLNFGQVLAVGTPSEVRADRSVQEAYLGGDHAAG
ncbi:ABC transporter ATP-binding protein [Fuscovulum ytuae]|uniref:ABC transporter ATP-binding protein n=1 Tax=Fuscovulum ytuae TaxID=3042299 RepID=A0ABY8QD73_9RHOB|nr:ABC transporter ATP-binding protein [Fuscovulum sp. YMD61]WGV18401.1 ABC transporter ATP-binding protein [Fuscovulum sp. YMD61]